MYVKYLKQKIVKYVFLFILTKLIIYGDGDWGLGIGDWGLGPIPNPQSPIPNPQSPSPYIILIFNIN
jgi:hypothetical protein